MTKEDKEDKRLDHIPQYNYQNNRPNTTYNIKNNLISVQYKMWISNFANQDMFCLSIHYIEQKIYVH